MVQGCACRFGGFRARVRRFRRVAGGRARQAAERFSFALAVVLTPPVVAREAWRLFKPKPGMAALPHGEIAHLAAPGLVGMVFSFLAGLVALRWLSQWLETGRWQWFGVYCLVAAGVVFYSGDARLVKHAERCPGSAGLPTRSALVSPGNAGVPPASSPVLSHRRCSLITASGDAPGMGCFVVPALKARFKGRRLERARWSWLARPE